MRIPSPGLAGAWEQGVGEWCAELRAQWKTAPEFTVEDLVLKAWSPGSG